MAPPVKARRRRIRFRDIRRGVAVGLLAATPVLLISLWPLLRFRDTKSWPSASARVTRSEVVTVLEPRESKYNPGVRERRRLMFEYAYEVDGQKYRSSRFSAFGDRPSDTELLERFPVGWKVHIHYKPTNPAVSFIELGTPTVNRTLIIAAVIVSCFFAGIATLWFDASTERSFKPLS